MLAKAGGGGDKRQGAGEPDLELTLLRSEVDALRAEVGRAHVAADELLALVDRPPAPRHHVAKVLGLKSLALATVMAVGGVAAAAGAGSLPRPVQSAMARTDRALASVVPMPAPARRVADKSLHQSESARPAVGVHASREPATKSKPTATKSKPTPTKPKPLSPATTTAPTPPASSPSPGGAAVGHHRPSGSGTTSPTPAATTPPTPPARRAVPAPATRPDPPHPPHTSPTPPTHPPIPSPHRPHRAVTPPASHRPPHSPPPTPTAPSPRAPHSGRKPGPTPRRGPAPPVQHMPRGYGTAGPHPPASPEPPHPSPHWHGRGPGRRS